MDYKEKYEMALEGIQEILDSGEDSIKMSRLQLRLQGIFPELRETEDKKIRKWIIDDITFNMNNEPLHNSEYRKKAEKAIAWLEKQKGNIGGISANWSEEDETNLTNTIIMLKEGASHHFLNSSIVPCVNWLIFLKDRVGCKANCTTIKEWSEEEIEKAAQEWDSKANFNPFYMTMENGKPTGVKQHITTHKESFKAGVNWILKYGVQPKQEWSEEDKDYYDAIIAKLEVTQEDAALTDNQMNFLKSLRPLKRWKPSEDDIIILEKLIKGELEPKTFQATLHGILEQLKKLKEE